MRGRVSSLGVCTLLIATMFVGMDIGFEVIENAEGATIYVDDDYTVEDLTHKKTIQAAIDASNAGDTVYVFSGNYVEKISVKNDIILNGENKDSTIIDYDAEDYNWKVILGSGSSMSGFSLYYYYDGAIYMNSRSSFTSNKVLYYGEFSMLTEPYAIAINSNCKIIDNYIDGYIDGSGSSSLIKNNYIKERIDLNSFNGQIEDNYVYAIFLHSSNGVIIKNNDIFTHAYPSNHEGYYSAGMHLLNCNGISIIKNNFNSEEHAIYAEDSSGSILKSVIKIWWGVGIFLKSSNFEILYSSISGPNDICGIYVESSTIIIRNSTISFPLNNNIHDAIIAYSSSLYIVNSTIINADFIIWGCHPIILNSKFDKSRVNIDCGSLTVQWYLHIFVTDENNYSIDNANVSIKDNENGSFSQNFVTGQDGFVWYAVVNEYIEFDNKYRIFHTPHKIIAWKNDLSGMASPDPFINQTQTIHVILKPGKFINRLDKGWNLISFQSIQNNSEIKNSLKTIEGKYDALQYYDSSNTQDLWKYKKVGKSFGNDLTHLNHTNGLFIHITQPGETIFRYNGTPPTKNISIPLFPGWNLVGFPSIGSKNRNAALNNLVFGTHVQAMSRFDAATQSWRDVSEKDELEVGKGYWIYAKSNCVWEVPL